MTANLCTLFTLGLVDLGILVTVPLRVHYKIL